MSRHEGEPPPPMDMGELPQLRPMDTGELLDGAFRIYRRAWKPLLLIGLMGAFPSILLSGLTSSYAPIDPAQVEQGFWFESISLAMEGDYSRLILMAAGYTLLLLLIGLLYPLLQGAAIAVCARTIMGQSITLGTALRTASHRYFPLLGTYLLLFVLYILAIPALTLAGLLVLAVLTVPLGLIALTVFVSFVGHAVVVEKTGGGIPALRRSVVLVRGYFWRLLGLGLLFVLLVAVLESIISFAVGAISFSGLTSGLTPWLVWLQAVLSGLSSAVVTPFLLVGLTLAYYDIRMRKEGFDLEMLINTRREQQDESARGEW